MVKKLKIYRVFHLYTRHNILGAECLLEILDIALDTECESLDTR
jgi:hypothetical protein